MSAPQGKAPLTPSEIAKHRLRALGADARIFLQRHRLGDIQLQADGVREKLRVRLTGSTQKQCTLKAGKDDMKMEDAIGVNKDKLMLCPLNDDIFKLSTKNPRYIRVFMKMLFWVARKMREWAWKKIYEGDQDALRRVLMVVHEHYVLWSLELRDGANESLKNHYLVTLTVASLRGLHAFPYLSMKDADWREYLESLEDHDYSVFEWQYAVDMLQVLSFAGLTPTEYPKSLHVLSISQHLQLEG
jgi:hypothetical protein